MHVSMMPSQDPKNPNRQLKIAFGGQSGTLQEGEVPLKVVSIQPLSKEQMAQYSQAQSQGTGAKTINFTVGQSGGQQGNPQGSQKCGCPKCYGR